MAATSSSSISAPSSSSTFDNASPSTTPRITRIVFLTATIALLCLALVGAAVRTLVRWYHYRRLGLSDYLLIFSCLSLSAEFAITWLTNDAIYEYEFGQAASDPSKTRLGAGIPLAAVMVLPWITLYAVKFSFLVLFKRLVRQTRSLGRYWWVALMAVITSFGVTIALSVLAGVLAGNDPLEDGTVFTNRFQPLYIGVSTGLDVVTGILITIVPLKLLWALRLRPLTKLMIGGILSLSSVMIGIAIVRAALATIPAPATGESTNHSSNDQHEIDMVWLAFWQTIEAEVSVIMLSFTAVRMFVHDSQFRQFGTRRRHRSLMLDDGEDGEGEGVEEEEYNGEGGDREQQARVESPEPKELSEIQYAGADVTSDDVVIRSPQPADPLLAEIADDSTQEQSIEGSLKPSKSVREEWLRPKSNRSKLIRKISETSLALSSHSNGNDAADGQQQNDGLQGMVVRKVRSRPRLTRKYPSADDVVEYGSRMTDDLALTGSVKTSKHGERRWPRTPRVLHFDRSPRFGSPRHRSLERGDSIRQPLVESPSSPTMTTTTTTTATTTAADVMGLAFDFASAVWAAPASPNTSLRSLPGALNSKKKNRKGGGKRRSIISLGSYNKSRMIKYKRGGGGAGRTESGSLSSLGIRMNVGGGITEEDEEERQMRLEEARQAEEDRRIWLAMQARFENERPLPPPVARPAKVQQQSVKVQPAKVQQQAVTVVQQRKEVKEEKGVSEGRQGKESRVGAKQTMSSSGGGGMPGGMF